MQPRKASLTEKPQKNYQNEDYETGGGLAGFGAHSMRNRQQK